jgi:hypothetical protein
MGVLRNFSFSHKGYVDIKRLKTTDMSDILQMDQIRDQWRARISIEIHFFKFYFPHIVESSWIT